MTATTAPDPTAAAPTDRRTRRRLRNRAAILAAAAEVMSDRGVDEATMNEISERADVALGSLYNHFGSKEALAVAVVDAEIETVARSIEEQTADFDDPAMVFAFGCATVMRHATTNNRWRHLLDSPEIIADRFYAGFGPYAIADMRRAIDAGRFRVPDVALAWRLTTWTIIGASSAVCNGEVAPTGLRDALVAILGIVGLGADDAAALVRQLADSGALEG